MDPVIAIFDIGKTNKKLFLFDEDYRIRLERSVHLSETVDEDGDHCEDLDALTGWVIQAFKEVCSLPEFDVKAFNYSTYGASFVHLGKDRKPVAPLYNYLKPYPEGVRKRFYNNFAGEAEFSRITASPVLGSLNSGMQLYRMKYERPSVFESITVSLHLPQYISSLFTEKFYSDITSIGCHTNLWDFTANHYHPWVTVEGIGSKLAPIQKSDTVVEFRIGDKILYSGIGLHDSSSALIPYLAIFPEPFLLLSTGTWCISLNPFNNQPLTPKELEQDCLCYLTYKGEPVKASRLFTGYFHEQETHRLAEHFNKSADYYKEVGQLRDWRQHLISKTESVPDFSAGDLSSFGTYEEAYIRLMEEIISRQVKATRLVLQPADKNIFVDGGFSSNPIFMQLLASAFPAVRIYAAKIVQASAMGAAMAIHERWNTKHVSKDLMGLKRYAPG